MADKKHSKQPKTNSTVQDQFFELFRKTLPKGIGMAEEIADVLGISVDGAYRRLRGETEVTLAEISRITKKYNISIDEVLGKSGTTVTFNYIKLTDSEENFINYLSRLHSQLTLINQFSERKIYYVADEVPLFYSFGSPKLTEFKLFFWQRSVVNIEKYQKEKFRYGLIPQHLIELASKSYLEYMNIPSTEVWTDETVLTNLKQIEFYFHSGLVSKQDAIELLQEHKKLVEKVNVMAESGRKNQSDKEETFLMYSSEVVLGTNCIYAIMGAMKYSYISFNSINSLTTSNSEFCEETENWLRNLEKKSSLISGVSEKQRYQFFAKMYATIDSCIESVTKTA